MSEVKNSYSDDLSEIIEVMKKWQAELVHTLDPGQLKAWQENLESSMGDMKAPAMILIHKTISTLINQWIADLEKHSSSEKESYYVVEWCRAYGGPEEGGWYYDLETIWSVHDTEREAQCECDSRNEGWYSWSQPKYRVSKMTKAEADELDQHGQDKPRWE